MTVRELLKEAQEKLHRAGVPNADYDARVMLAEAYGKTSAELLAELDRPLCPGATGGTEPAGITACPGDCGAMLTFRASVNQRCRRVPLQQITGHAGFMGLDFKVNRHVLIPRADTETLAETVLAQEKERDIRVLDLCTGSGCIAIALKHHGNYASVTAAELDREALNVAIRNASILKTEIRLVQSDLFDAFEKPDTGEKETADRPARFDVIVSNPPYIPGSEIDSLDPEVRDHDPRLALDGGEDGLDFYRRISEGAVRHLVPGGRIYFEIGCDQADAVMQILEQAGFSGITVVKDLAGLDRTIYGRLS